MFLEKVINHFNSYMIISNMTLYIMSIAILMLSIVYMFQLFFKKQRFERNMVLAGVAARALMFIGFTIEFAHQMTTYDKFTPIYSAKWDAVVQLVHFLFWGYIAVAGIYYLFAMGIKRYRGFIYTFDIAMMSIPIVFGLVLGIFGGLYRGGVETLLLVPLPAACLYVFFQCYWTRKPLHYLAFFLTAGISVACAYKFKPLKLILPFSAFIILLGAYNLIMAEFQIKKYRQVLIVFPVIFIFAANPFYNLWTMVEDGQAYAVSNIFYKDVKNVSLKEIENRMRAALENEEDKLVLKRVSSGYNYKAYELQLGDYDISTNDIDGKRIEILRKDNKNTEDVIKDTNEAELMSKTLELFRKLGYTYNSSNIEAIKKIEGGEYIINFHHRYPSGVLSNDKIPMAQVRWDGSGKLKRLKVSGAFDIKDYSSVKISDVQIKEIINNFYKKLSKTTPDYVINYVTNLWRTTVSIACENGDSFKLDGASGEIINYMSSADASKFDKTKEGISKNREKAINYAKAATTFWDRADFKETQLGKDYAYGQYNFTGAVPWFKVGIETLVNIKGELVYFGQNIDPDGKKYSNDAFKINRKEAINLVEENYNPLKIYTTKAALVLATDDYYNTELKWRVGVLLFMSSEKQYYLVEVNTGMVERVSDNGGGE
jgi:hypothetical protein